ncbi:hypothetical protein EE612_035483 [Oryza sativa]|nr:hypothetical protein EE612_035483 [Oryza sativa]
MLFVQFPEGGLRLKVRFLLIQMLLSSSQSILLGWDFYFGITAGCACSLLMSDTRGVSNLKWQKLWLSAVRCARRWRRVTRKLFWLQIA